MNKQLLADTIYKFAKVIGMVNNKAGSAIMAIAGAVADGSEEALARAVLEWVGKRQIELGQTELGKETLSVARSKDN